MVNILDLLGDKPVAKKTTTKKSTKKADKKEVQAKDCMERVHIVMQLNNAQPMTVRFSDEALAMRVYRELITLWRNRATQPNRRFYEFANEYGTYVVDVWALTYLAMADLSALHSMRPFQLPA